jgi:DNA-binding TFAR19-related protein (PDSD5 family)
MEEDLDLDIIKRRKLLELAKRAATPSKSKRPEPREVVKARLVDRGLEVLEAAERQYPRETAIVVRELAKLIEQGVLKGPIRGGELLGLFRRLGLQVRLETGIRVERHGKLIPFGKKLLGEE